MTGKDSVRQREGTYQFTTVDYEHPNPRFRTGHVSVRLQMDYDELVAGARIEVTA